MSRALRITLYLFYVLGAIALCMSAASCTTIPCDPANLEEVTKQRDILFEMLQGCAQPGGLEIYNEKGERYICRLFRTTDI
jgi:hypothetical protein